MLDKNPEISLRLGRLGDGRNVARIHYRAIHEIAFNDYSKKILNAWGRSLWEKELAIRQ